MIQRRLTLLLVAIIATLSIHTAIAQEYPLYSYEEPRVGTAPDAEAWAVVPEGLNITWASRDVHYSLHEVPAVERCTEITISAWRGERANIQALLFSKSDEGVLRLRMTEWRKGGASTGITAAEARFVNYVITDDYKACGDHPKELPAWLVPDVIDIDQPHAVPAMETRPVWCTIEVPRDMAAGEYVTKLQVLNDKEEVVGELTLNINVNKRSLPEVAEQRFHLDLWQQPYAVSRYHCVARWSDEHLEALRPYLQALGRAGQCTVSAILFYEPWGVQTHVPDRFDPMVETIKTKDGKWAFDYTIFDRYVELCAECGITKQINCFSMVPWDMNFRYFDEASGEYRFIRTSTFSMRYYHLWHSFLSSFKQHLQQKGWFERCRIAMDERSEADMLNAYNIAHSLGFEVALAGNYHASLVDKLADFCVSYAQVARFTEGELLYRKDRDYVTTFYTSCAEREPNIYSCSLPAEAAYLPIYAAAMGIDGYLHWSWINWAEEPLMDTRYRLFGSGDTYFYYPGNRSSVRFERLIEGIHQYEKIQILRDEYKGDRAKLAKLDTLLSRFADTSITGAECAALVNDMERFLNGE